LRPQPVRDAPGPALEVGEDSRAGRCGRLSYRSCLTAGTPGKAHHPSVLPVAGRSEILSDERVQAIGRVMAHLLETDAAGAGPIVVPLKRADDQQLFWRLRPPPPITGSFLLQHGISVSSISVRRASGAPPYCPAVCNTPHRKWPVPIVSPDAGAEAFIGDCQVRSTLSEQVMT
jgi:hypothetical protein